MQIKFTFIPLILGSQLPASAWNIQMYFKINGMFAILISLNCENTGLEENQEVTGT